MSDQQREAAFTNPNKNCLAEIQCPKCGFFDQFTIQATAMFELTDDGSNLAAGDIDWGDDAYIRCGECRHEGTVAEFRTIPEEIYGNLILVKETGDVERHPGPKQRKAQYITVAEIEELLGARYTGETWTHNDLTLIAMEEHVRSAYALNNKIKLRFGLEIRGPVLVVPTECMR